MNPLEVDPFDTVTTRAMHLCAARNDSRVNAGEFCDLVALLVQVAVRDALDAHQERRPDPEDDECSCIDDAADPDCPVHSSPAARTGLATLVVNDALSPVAASPGRRSDRRRIELDMLEQIKHRLREAHGEKAARGGLRLRLGALDAICKDFGISKKTATTLSQEVAAELKQLLPAEPLLADAPPAEPPPDDPPPPVEPPKPEPFLQMLERRRVTVGRPPDPEHRALTEAERDELAKHYAKACENSDDLVPVGFAQKQADALRVPIKTIYDALDPAMKARASEIEAKKALARLTPPAPRADRFKSRHVAGRYGGGET